MKRMRKITPRAPMLVQRGLCNTEIETVERMALQAFIGGWATTEHFNMLANMHSLLVLAGSTDKSREWARNYAQTVVGPALQKIAERYKRQNVMSVTTGERKVLGEFISMNREFWLRQPSELFEVTCVSLKQYHQELAARSQKERPCTNAPSQVPM